MDLKTFGTELIMGESFQKSMGRVSSRLQDFNHSYGIDEYIAGMNALRADSVRPCVPLIHRSTLATSMTFTLTCLWITTDASRSFIVLARRGSPSTQA